MGWVTAFLADKPSRYATNHEGKLNLAIPVGLGMLSTGDGYGYR